MYSKLSAALLLISGALICTDTYAWGQATVPGQTSRPPAPGQAARDLFVTIGKSLVVESPVNIQRVSIGDSTKAEAVAVSPREVLINGKAAGETSLIIWQQGGNRLLFDLHVRPSTLKIEALRQQFEKEFPGQDITIAQEDGDVFLRGTVPDLTSAARATALAGTLGKPVNLLRVKVPGVEEQILLKVRFANVDRAAAQELGANIVSTGALNTIGSVTTGQFPSPTLQAPSQGAASFALSDALNIFLFRRDLNLATTIRALQTRRLLEILAEPNVLAMNGKQAAFLAGGEFPFPVVQAGVGGAGAITLQWREFGVRINFLPTITPRGTIRLRVTPEVSSLDFNNAVTISGFTVPAISTRRVQTEIELENQQTFAIGGLLDNRVIESLNKIPGLGDIPLLGKLFQSRARTKNNTELLVVVTPELVRPIPAGMPVPAVQMPQPFLTGAPTVMPRTPGVNVTGPVPVKSVQETMPVEQLAAQQEKEQTAAPSYPAIQYVPVPVMPQPAQPQPQTPAPAPARPATPSPQS